MSLPGFSPEADASTPPKVVKSDRLDLRPIGADCSPQAWPYYEANCLRDRRETSRQAKPVRLITTDRIARSEVRGRTRQAAAIADLQLRGTRATNPGQGR